jgi:serine/threonine-protein kinase RsbW
MSRLNLVIDSDLDEVTLVALAVNRICLHVGLDEAQASQVELCIVEAVTNVIRHGYHGRRGEKISIAISTGTKQIHIEVSDSGTCIPAHLVEKLIRGTSVVEAEALDRASLAESGRGLQIIHDLMDEVAYTSENGLNCLQLTKYIPALQQGE